jgi:hypothetical protein
VQARADADDTLTACERAVLAALVEIAGDRSWCRPSKAEIVARSGVPPAASSGCLPAVADSKGAILSLSATVAANNAPPFGRFYVDRPKSKTIHE